ncbi:hypothetical protein ACA910_002699 [Epithemia clementina (nom. ined.)]
MFGPRFLFSTTTFVIFTLRLDHVMPSFVPIEIDDSNPNLFDLFAASSYASSVHVTDVTCPLDCRNGASCVKLKTTRIDDNSVSVDKVEEWQCDCPEGFFGTNCELQLRRLLTTTCGDLVCQHHGSCAKGHSYEVEGAVCDCTGAVQVIGNAPPYELKRWVGRTCEIEVQKEDYCLKNQTHLFCVNGGSCRVKANNFVDKPCSCTDGFTGRYCEYAVEHVRSDCTLTCSGKGTCQHGINSVGNSGANKALELLNGGTSNFMHCVCNKGFAGTNCEYQYTQCDGSKGRYCYHGTTCHNGTVACDCANDKSDVKRAGEFCQFEAHDNCKKPKSIDAESLADLMDPGSKGMTASEIPFCVNGGVCYSVDDTHFYCLCGKTDVGFWTGKRCEIRAEAPHVTPAPTASAMDTFSPTIDSSATDWPSTIVPTAKETADPTASEPVVKCGPMECRNGGVCAEGHNYHADGALCDCTHAIQFSGGMLKRYVGRTCQKEVEQNNYCPGTDNIFCVNGGSCRLKAANFTLQPCQCVKGFTGRHCEYSIEDVQDSCVLTCSDNGTCQHGMNPSEETGPNGLLTLQNGGTSNFMHCICKDGYAGTNCEYEAVKCGGRRRYCFHGSTCVEITGGGSGSTESQVCECSSTNGKKFGGSFCEFIATDYCENPVDIDDDTAMQTFDASYKMSSAEDPYCVNDGRCFRVTEYNDQYFCSCELSWTGKRCESKVVAPHVTPPPTAAWTETWPPTIEGSLTNRPSKDISAPNRPSKGISAPKIESSFSPAAKDEMSGGGKFGVVLVVFIGTACIAAAVIYLVRSRSRLYQGTGKTPQYNINDNLYGDRHMDLAPFEDIPGTTSSSVSDTVVGGGGNKYATDSDYPPEGQAQMSQTELV